MSTKNQKSGITVVRQFYDLAAQDKFDEAGQYLAPDIVLRETTDVPFGGDYHGLEGNAELMGKITSVFNVAIEKIEYLDASDPVVVKILARFTSKATGKTVEMQVVEMLTVRDGLISDIDIYYKNPSTVAALWPR